MTKDELYLLCKKKGNVYCIEKYFSSHFLDLYSELYLWEFPKDFKFSQKLYHFFNNDPDFKLGLCPVCGNRCTFEYEYDGKKHYYHPDFLIDGKLYEVKGEQFFEGDKMINPYDRTQDGLYEAKHQCMIKNNIIILKENDIKNASYTK